MSEEEIDFEIDSEELAPRRVDTALGDPSVIAEDVNVVYRILGSTGKRVRGSSNDGALKRLARKGAKLSTTGITEIHAVRGVSFVARDGESIGVLGTNGSGKSTLLRALAGMQPVDSGNVYLSGNAALMGVNAALMRNLTGERNIMIGCLALGMQPEEIRDRFDEIVDFAELGDAVYLPMSTYSSGMAARLRFAISTAKTPDVLMIDEALATGDASFRIKSRERIDEIREDAGTIFLVSHSLATVKSMCSRAIWLDEGTVRMDGPVDDVAEAYREYAMELRRDRRRRRKSRRLAQ